MQVFSDFDLKGKKVIMRVDFNVPLNEDLTVSDDSRLRAALPSIRLLLEKGAAVILMSHLGRPKNGPENKFSLRHIVEPLETLLKHSIQFVDDCIGTDVQKASVHLKAGEILLLENLRFHIEEKKGDLAFAKQLANLADFYVNDAFGTAHRAHASTAIIAQFFEGRKAAGLLMAREVDEAKRLMEQPAKPFTAILGGAKVSDKIPVIENLLKIVDHILIGGGMAYTFIAALGGKIGKSICEPEQFELCLTLLEKAKNMGVNIHLPVDSIIADQFNNDAKIQFARIDEIPDHWLGLDIGADTAKSFRDIILSSNTVLWNGPMGVFEMKTFSGGTRVIGYAIAEATENGCYSLVGGGDSVAAINQMHLADDISFVSTGGGAMLELLEGKALPGIIAIGN